MKKQTFALKDIYLNPFIPIIERRARAVQMKKKELLQNNQSLIDFASGYLYFGAHGTADAPVFREYAPHACAIYLIGDFNDWKEEKDFQFVNVGEGCWELSISRNCMQNGDKYLLSMHWENGHSTRIPAYSRYLHQDEITKSFCAQVYLPVHHFSFKNKRPQISTPIIYEAHVGMSSEEGKVASFQEFRTERLSYIAEAGYNTIQLMAVQEHPYYGSYGYHVANFFAVSSRFGTPEDFRQLIDDAHELGLAVIIDLVHSHSVKNEKEGLAVYDGDAGMFFHTDERRMHQAWDSLCFNYSKNDVLHFLLSNCKYWMEEYFLDGFRFDGVTSMLYLDHGLERNFTCYDDYFNGAQDEAALIYISLANELIHQIYPHALCVAEEMSGMPGLCAPVEEQGLGFDYRLAMGVPDYWIRLCKDSRDEDWQPGDIFYQLTSKRPEERTINYAESHDQALVGDKTLITHLMGAAIYSQMHKNSVNNVVDRGIALHKMIRLVTFGLSQGGYLNFMGNEFGHPEWIDFPREGNNWSYQYARRQWSLYEHADLRFRGLGDFDKHMLALEKNDKFINQTYCECICDDNQRKILAFRRGLLLFVFNFHPSESYKDLQIATESGKYAIVLNTDDDLFGGFSRVDNNYLYFTQREILHIYLPCRSALVFKYIPSKKAR